MGNLLQNIREIHHIGDDTPENFAPFSVYRKLMERGIWATGISDAGAGYEMARLNPETGHVLVCFGGEGLVLVDEDWKRCASGTAYLSPPNVPLAYHTIGRTRWNFAWVYLRADAQDTSPVPFDKCTLIDADPRRIVAAIEGLCLESAGDCDSETIDRWADLIQHYTHKLTHPQGQTDLLWRLWAQVEANLSDPWSLELLAEHAGLGHEALRRLCVREFGRSPMRHVTHLRMRRAETMLRSTPCKLYTIAHAVGYENVFAFSAAFTRWKGRPPKLCRHP